MSRELCAAGPEELLLREAQVGGRVLVTSLRAVRAAHKATAGGLYVRRWNIELDLRCIKTMLGMEVLRCQTPAMVERERCGFTRTPTT